MPFKITTAIILLFVFTTAAYAQVEHADHFNLFPHAPGDSIGAFNLHFQTTYIYQYKPQFYAPYEGKNSLTGAEEKQNSLTATLYLGARLWKGAAIYINPEIAGGSGLSGALGMAGSSNGETFRVGDPAPTLYMGRAYLEQTFAMGKEQEYERNDANQMPGWMPKDYIRFTAGKYSLGDLFDNNEYSNSPRTQFMNWALMNNGAWDYAANVRGYTLAFTAELQKGAMNYKIAAAALPTEANGAKLQTNLDKGLALNAEIVRSYTLAGHDGHVRLLGYYNTAETGNYEAAIQHPGVMGPDITLSRGQGLRHKTGFGLNADQQLNDTWCIFGRLGWNDGKNETWAFTEIDRTASLGLLANGKKWNRENDHGGIAIVANGLSKQHADYLKAGGNGFILGDSTLNYATELVGEVYYSLKPTPLPIWISGDYQFCVNPGYNADRGPVNIFSVRIHVEL